VIIIVVLLLLLISAIIVAQNLKIRVLVDFSDNGIWTDAYCLYPLLRMRIALDNNVPYLIVYLFKKKIYSKPLKRHEKTHHKLDFLKNVNIQGLIVNAYYGFRDPFSTGIFSGMLGIAKALPVPVHFNQYPDFLASKNFLRIEALGYLKLGKTIKNYVLSHSKIKKGE